MVAFMMFGWFGTVINESLKGMYNEQVDRSFRQGMMWFIFSEVMFFAAFFGALFYARVLSVPWLLGEDFSTHHVLWSTFGESWPTNGPGNVGGEFQTMGPWGIPGDQHPAAVDIGRHHYPVALGAQGQRPDQDRAVAGGDGGIGCRLPRVSRPTSTSTPTRS